MCRSSSWRSARSAALHPPRKVILVTDADQWSKLALVKEIAEEVWAD